MRVIYAVCLSMISFDVAGAATQVQKVEAAYSGGAYNFQTTEIVTYDGVKRREQNDASGTTFLIKHHERTDRMDRADLGKRWEIDDKKKRYTESLMKDTTAQTSFEQALREGRPHQTAGAPSIPIKRIDAKVDGPGAETMINGFKCQPYLISLTMVYEDPQTHQEGAHQTMIEKRWVSSSEVLTSFESDERHFDEAVLEQTLGKQATQDIKNHAKTFMDTFGIDLQASATLWAPATAAYAKIKGVTVRSIEAFSLRPGQATPEPSDAEASDSSAVVQPSDLTGGVGGLVSGMASRWASKKIEKKMAEHPAWVDELKEAFPGQVIGSAAMTELKTADVVHPDATFFEVPAGFKKVDHL